MSLRASLLIFLALALLCVAELAVYFKTGMSRALSGPGLAMVAGYKFLWLTVLTGAAGLAAPIAAIFGTISRRKNVGWVSWILLIWLAMLGYTAFSFLNAPSASNPMPSPVPSSAVSKKIGGMVEFAGAHVERLDAETIRVMLEFENKSSRRIKEIDYSFTFTDDKNEALLSMDLREGLSIPPQLKGASTLSWTKSGFKDPAHFDRLEENLVKGTLQTSVTVQRIVFTDGTVVEGD